MIPLRCKCRLSQEKASLLCLVLLGALTMVGCGDGRPSRVPVSGKVLIDGAPLGYGFVRVSPNNARAATGKLGPDGTFTLKTFEDGDGVVLGVHPVIVGAGESLNERETQWHAPQEYSRAETSDLTVNIEGPNDDLVINLSWEGDKPFRTRDGVRIR